VLLVAQGMSCPEVGQLLGDLNSRQNYNKDHAKAL
jgi:hypothetical protein